MQKTPSQSQIPDILARELNDELVSRYGQMLPSSVLVKVLGYPSAQAYRQALARGTVPVPLFRIANRRGRFALARDVAVWLSQQRQSAPVATTRGSAANQITRILAEELFLMALPPESKA